MGLGVIVNLMLLTNAIVVVVTASRGAEFFIFATGCKHRSAIQAASADLLNQYSHLLMALLLIRFPPVELGQSIQMLLCFVARAINLLGAPRSIQLVQYSTNAAKGAIFISVVNYDVPLFGQKLADHVNVFTARVPSQRQ